MLAVILCVCFPIRARAEDAADPNNAEEKIATIELTKLDVNDANLELSYKIKNKTDHEVWICDDVSAYLDMNFEVYLSEDEQSLLIRKRLNVPTIVQWTQWPYGRYVLLRSGQERNESISLRMPVRPLRLFASGQATSDHARRLVVEIGFYNEDLPGMIHDIIETVEKLNCAPLDPGEYASPFFVRFFKGIWIERHVFPGGLAYFKEHIYQEGNEQILIPYSRQNLDGEKVLRIEVDGVHIPYEEGYKPNATTKGDQGKDSETGK
jgi:hypothetical protein